MDDYYVMFDIEMKSCACEIFISIFLCAEWNSGLLQSWLAY